MCGFKGTDAQLAWSALQIDLRLLDGESAAFVIITLYKTTTLIDM
jgi:hypothetical protein